MITLLLTWLWKTTALTFNITVDCSRKQNERLAYIIRCHPSYSPNNLGNNIKEGVPTGDYTRTGSTTQIRERPMYRRRSVLFFNSELEKRGVYLDVFFLSSAVFLQQLHNTDGDTKCSPYL